MRTGLPSPRGAAVVVSLLIGSLPIALNGHDAGAPQQTPTAVFTAETAAIDTFVDPATRGRDEREFEDKWIRIVTTAHPEGFLTRVKSFDPATGRFTLYDEVPAQLAQADTTY